MNKAIAIALAIAVLSIAILAISLHGQPVTSPPQMQEQPGPALAAESVATPTKPMTRTEFDTMIMHKTKEEVISLLGRPDSTDTGAGSGSNRETWFWHKLTYDPVSNKADDLVQVYFVDGVVDYIAH